LDVWLEGNLKVEKNSKQINAPQWSSDPAELLQQKSISSTRRVRDPAKQSPPKQDTLQSNMKFEKQNNLPKG